MRLSEYMELRKLSDEQVAAAIGRSRPTVSRIRRWVQRPDWDTVEKLYKFSKGAVTPNDFLR